jgi:hypothetical protein
MSSGKAGVALSITTLALLAYSILALYGMEYLFDGDHLLAIAIWLIGSIILSISTYYMCKSKANRNKRNGLLIEVPSLLVAIVILLAGSIPFTMFVSVIRQENTFVNSITETANHVRAIDSCYQVFANNRIDQYEKYLISHNYKTTAIRLRVNSLKRRLIPENTDSISHERKEWLGRLNSVSIWNISTAKNFHYVMMACEDWCEQYRQRSSIFYEGEDTTRFEYDKSVMASQSTYANLRIPHSPDTFGLLAAIICIVGILTTYFYIRRPRNRYSGHHR